MPNPILTALIVTFATALAGCSALTGSSSQPSSMEYKTTSDGQALEVELLPTVNHQAQGPLVVWVNNESQYSQSTGQQLDFTPLFDALNQQGYQIAKVDYRYGYDALFPIPVVDVNDAINHVLKQAQSLGIDRDKVVLMGAGSGAYLASLLTTANNDPDASFFLAGKAPRYQVVAAVDYYGVMDLPSLKGRSEQVDFDAPNSEQAQLLGVSPRLNPELAKQASVTHYLDWYTPPMMILHGDKDQVVPVSQSQLFSALLSKNGVVHRSIYIEGAGHHDPAFVSDEYIDKVRQFLSQYAPLSATK